MSFTEVEEKNSKGRWVRECKYEGITLENALTFTDDDWCETFFQSFENMSKTHKGKFLLLEWDIYETNLSNNTVNWTLIANRGGYDPTKVHGDFGNVIQDDYTPVVFDNTRSKKNSEGRQRLVMISPGKGHGTGEQGVVHRDLGEGRCVHLTNYMCSKETSKKEKKKLWQLVGKTALRRMNGTLRRYTGYFSSENGHRGEIASVDRDGHAYMCISTHGFGVPWLHVRVEDKPEYKDQANY